jgi:class 3 adenylate cyclase
MATWLAVAVLAVTITSLVVASILSLTAGEEIAEELADGQMSARASVKAEEVSRYLEAMRRQTAALASSEATAEIFARFTSAYQELSGLESADVDESADLVIDFYRDDFAPALQQTTGIPVGYRTLLPTTDPALYLQRHYIADTNDESGDLIDDADDGSAWSEVHRELHLGLYEITQRMGADDMYLIEPDNGIIVYSASKKPDFATSLDFGPHGGSTLAAIMRTVRESPEKGVATLIDMAPYSPDLGSPVMFVASPVYDGEQLTGILVFKISTDPIDAIVTSEGNWVEEGFGETGEVYLAGEDGRMRSVARPFVENPAAFLIDLETAGTATRTERSAIAGVGTTAVFLRASDTSELTAAAESDDLTRSGTDYLLRPVLSSVESVDLGEFTWFAVAHVATDEVAGPISDFRQALLIAVAIFVIGITFGTVSWARGVFRPVRSISERLRLAQNDEPIPEPEGMENAPKDFTDLSDNIDEMLQALRTRQADLERASQERIDTVRSLLPPAIAERVQSGDRDVIDRIPQASVVVVVTDGLGEFVRIQEIARTQELLESLIAEMDAAATHHGLERARLVGDSYYAGCGLSQPFLDHVPRSISFALDARDIVEELNSRFDTPLLVGVGIHTGPVTVGLTGSQKLVYDLWGETVRAAHFLARKAKPREILVTSDVRRLLPPDVAVAEQQVSGEDESIFQVLGIQVERGVGDE